MALSLDRRVLSPICPVHWQGWKSDTYALQQAGWDIAVEHVDYGRETRLLMRNQTMRLAAISARVPLDLFMRTDGYNGPPFQVVHVATDFKVALLEASFNFQQIDAKPQVTTEPLKDIRISEFFATPLVRTEEIIVEPKDVSAMLEQVRQMQAPMVHEIRQREQRREREAGPREVFHAQILSLAA